MSETSGKKIAIFLRDLGLGGVERCAVLVGEALAARGFAVTLVLLGGSRNLWTSRINHIQVVDVSKAWQPLKPWTWLAGWRAARCIAREHDVVIAGTFLLPLYMAYAATLGLRKRVSPEPTCVASADVTRSHRSGHQVHEDGEQRTTKSRPAQQQACRVMGWVHGPFYELDAFAKMNPVHRAACQFVYRRLDELIFVSNHAKASMARWLDCEPKSTWQVLPNFVDAAQALPAVLPRKEGAPLRLLFVGRIAVEKQPHLWLDTLAALNAKHVAAHLTIVGDGPLEEWLKNEVLQRGLSQQIHFAGRQDNVSRYLGESDVLLLTSSFEGCPLVVLEAMPIGIMVASTNAGGVYELFAERRAEFVVNQASGEALAELIIQQQTHAAELAAWLKQRAEFYSQGALIARWVALLQRAYDV
ncbi:MULTISPECIES: glycosyltransferase [Deefgea]|uniref:Glycosyltransferase n=1 Tax=Deefgea chitinilytica TaxID=570276 RepID=A0ABS2CC96_9NEIS|nr:MULTISPECIES: glycosyltransferase [Deefgea]MBM5571774.1 glycosyltransferase [Deefgea chitinilytica]MBM9889009.1 glycosyltransferase [Deefgea sp. CFH1-16]